MNLFCIPRKFIYTNSDPTIQVIALETKPHIQIVFCKFVILSIHPQTIISLINCVQSSKLFYTQGSIICAEILFCKFCLHICMFKIVGDLESYFKGKLVKCIVHNIAQFYTQLVSTLCTELYCLRKIFQFFHQDFKCIFYIRQNVTNLQVYGHFMRLRRLLNLTTLRKYKSQILIATIPLFVVKITQYDPLSAQYTLGTVLLV